MAVEYVNPPRGGERYLELRHLVFVKSQVFMFTPDEVGPPEPPQWSFPNDHAAVCFGRSSWFESFSPLHLERCEHYRLMFYDEYLDIICEGIEAKTGPYRATGSQPGGSQP